jgi:hypothetical protein|tara:strand:- start:47 stop:331 length:285 start_codon:yes stop_codon:yes gene_type:complete
MTKILKFPKRIKPYSETFLTNVKPAAIGDFIKGQHPDMSVRAADAMALAIIYSTYLQLVFDEEGHKVPDNIMDALDENDHSTFIWAAHDKKTLH